LGVHLSGCAAVPDRLEPLPAALAAETSLPGIAGGRYWGDIHAILDEDVYLDTIRVCGEGGSGCTEPNSAPVCGTINSNQLFADLRTRARRRSRRSASPSIRSSLIYRALGNAKADYRDKVEKIVTHIFVHELSKLVRASDSLTWHKDVKRKEEKE